MIPEDDTDAALTRRAVAGDHGAFAALARRHGPRLARTVRALGVSPSEVEDVVQTALIAAWRSLADYDPARPFLAWCSMIAANKARDWARRRRVRRAWTDGPSLDRPEAMAVADPEAGPEVIEARDRVRQIGRAVDALPERLRLPMVMTAVTGLTQQETADALGLSLKTIEGRLAQARARLAKVLRRA